MSNYENRLDDYVDVAERIRIFRERHPGGSLQPMNPARPFEILEVAGSTFVVYVAAAYRSPDDELPGIAVAWEPFPGRTPYTAGSELMNAETAAWGRAIVAALAADTKKIATLDEVRARRSEEAPRRPQETRQDAPGEAKSAPRSQSATPATEPQEKALYAISKKLDRLPPAKGTLTKIEAGKLIERLQAELDAKTLGDAFPDAGSAPEEPF